MKEITPYDYFNLKLGMFEILARAAAEYNLKEVKRLLDLRADQYPKRKWLDCSHVDCCVWST